MTKHIMTITQLMTCLENAQKCDPSQVFTQDEFIAQIGCKPSDLMPLCTITQTSKQVYEPISPKDIVDLVNHGNPHFIKVKLIDGAFYKVSYSTVYQIMNVKEEVEIQPN